MKKSIIATLTVATLLGGTIGIGDYAKAKETTNTVSLENTNISFKDVTKKSYAYDSIMYLAEKGIVKGYGNGYYGIKDNVTRGQVSALIARYLGLDTSKKYDNPYSDVKGHMFEKEILAVSDAKLMQGKGKGKFDPKATLTRAEMAQVLTNVFDLKVKANYDFHDMNEKHWANNAVRGLYSNGITKGTGDNKFNPSGKVTRGQYAEFLYRGIHLDENFEAKPIPKPEPPKPNKPQIEIDKEKEGWTFTTREEKHDFPLSPAHPETQPIIDQFLRDLKIDGNKITGKIPKYDNNKYTVTVRVSEGDDVKTYVAETIIKKSLTENHSNKLFSYNVTNKYPKAHIEFAIFFKKDASIPNSVYVDLNKKEVEWQNKR